MQLHRVRLIAVVVVLCAAWSCTDEDQPTRSPPGGLGPGGTGSGGIGDGTTGDSADGADVPDADSAPTDFVDGGVAATCSEPLRGLVGLGAPRVQLGDVSLFVAYEQVGDNQNPLVMRFDGDVLTWCERHETEPPDGRAVGLTWDGGPWAWVVYTVVGGGTALETAAADGWLSAYAPGTIRGGGGKVSVVGRVDVVTGALDAASFVIAVKSDGSVNSHTPAAAPRIRADGDIEFLGSSAHKPVDHDGRQAMLCTDYPFDTRYVWSPDLSTLRCADSSNCQSQRPCP